METGRLSRDTALLAAVLTVEFEGVVAEVVGDGRWRAREWEAWRLADLLLVRDADAVAGALDASGPVTCAYVALDAVVSAQALLMASGYKNADVLGDVYRHVVHATGVHSSEPALAPWRHTSAWVRSMTSVCEVLCTPGGIYAPLLATSTEDLDVLCAVAVCTLAETADAVFGRDARHQLALRFAPLRMLPEHVVEGLGSFGAEA